MVPVTASGWGCMVPHWCSKPQQKEGLGAVPCPESMPYISKSAGVLSSVTQVRDLF